MKQKDSQSIILIPFHSFSSKKVLEFVRSDSRGLSNKEAEIRLRQNGTNDIRRSKPLRPLVIFAKQFKSILVIILLVAASISFVFGHFIDMWVILGVVIFNAILGFVLEFRAEKSVEALHKMLVPQAKVLRDGRLEQIDAKNLVVGDIVFVQEGDSVPADGRILSCDELKVDEATLTGESIPQEKISSEVEKNAPLGDRTNILFLGTHLVSGDASMVVIATGNNTQLGLVADHMSRIDSVAPHFQKRIAVLARNMAGIAIFGTVMVCIAGIFFAGMETSEMLLSAIAILVSGIPEGLPAILTIVLAISAFRMSKKRAIVKSLSSIETLAVTDTILTDKTGTLTDNTMNIVKFFASGEKEIDISGEGWSPRGVFSQSGKTINPSKYPELYRATKIAGVCNDARVYSKKSEKKADEEVFDIVGDPTEAALLVFSRRAGISSEFLDNSEKRIDDLPFRSSRQFRATLVQNIEEKTFLLYVVGAPERIVSRCRFVYKHASVSKMTDSDQAEILKTVRRWSSDAIRVLALAYRERLEKTTKAREEDVQKLVFVGLVGMMDTPREGVSDAVASARKAGIRVVMTTGDHKETATAIARRVGIIHEEERSFEQVELEKMTDKEFIGAVKSATVFARLSPEMKLRITETLQQSGRIVAVTGDGVNDALALTRSDIGVAMGRNGSDVAKQAGDIILTDDNFSSIVSAIKEGRLVFNNVQRSSSFLVTTSFAEQTMIFGALSMNLPLPFIPTQILWLNLVTDGVTDIAIAAEPSHGSELSSRPRKSDEAILSREIFPYLILLMITMATVSLATFVWFLPEGLDRARAAAFTVLSATQLFNMFNMRSMHQSIFSIGILKNKFAIAAFVFSSVLLFATIYAPLFQKLFSFSPIAYGEFFVLFLLSSVILLVGELYKYFRFAKR